MASKPMPSDQDRSKADGNERLQRSVEESVPNAERLPGGADENPLGSHVRDIADGQKSGPGRSALEGGDEKAR